MSLLVQKKAMLLKMIYVFPHPGFIFSHFLGYVVKKIEAELRSEKAPAVSEFIQKIAGKDDCEIYEKIVCDSEFNKVISETVKECLKQNPNFNVSLLEEKAHFLKILSEEELYEIFKKMNEIKSDNKTELFCKQAEFIKKIGTNCIYKYYCSLSLVNLPFSAMSFNQFKSYISWRTRYIMGMNDCKIDDSFLIIHALEIINGIESKSTAKIIKKLANLINIRNSRYFNTFCEETLIKIIFDYYICNPIDTPFKNLAEENNLQIFFPHMFFGSEKIKK